MPKPHRVDRTDARLLLALSEHPRATVMALADSLGLSRNTVHARLARYDEVEFLLPFERRIDPEAIGYPIRAFITAHVTQSLLAQVAAALACIPQVLEVHGISGLIDLLVNVAAADADDLYRVAGQILAIPGVERTNTALVMRELVPYRIGPLVELGLGEER